MESGTDWHLTGDLDTPAGKGDPFAAAVRATRMAMIITDPRQPDNPIIFANDAFLQLSGYTRDDVVGRNCRFLQGPETDRDTVALIRSAITEGRDVALDILNYRKDGTPFWNALYISPVTDETGQLLFFFASQLDVSSRKAAELEVLSERDRIEAAVAERTAELNAALTARTELLHEVNHRVKNNLQLIAALVVMEARNARHPDTKASLKSLRQRIEALAVVHRGLYSEANFGSFDVSAFVREFAGEAKSMRDDKSVIVHVDAAAVQVSSATAAPVALLSSELVQIALARAAEEDGRDVRVELTVKPVDSGHYRFCVGSTAFGEGWLATVPQDARRFIDMLAGQLRAVVHWGDSDADPKTICVDLPIHAFSNGD